MLEKKGDAIKLRAKEFLDKYNIEVEMKKEVEKIILCYASNAVLGFNCKISHQWGTLGEILGGGGELGCQRTGITTFLPGNISSLSNISNPTMTMRTGLDFKSAQ